MSTYRHGYMVYAEDERLDGYDEEEQDFLWRRADDWINGLAWFNDFNQAVAMAKLGALSCQYPFVVLMRPCKKWTWKRWSWKRVARYESENKNLICPAWIFFPKNYKSIKMDI